VAVGERMCRILPAGEVFPLRVGRLSRAPMTPSSGPMELPAGVQSSRGRPNWRPVDTLAYEALMRGALRCAFEEGLYPLGQVLRSLTPSRSTARSPMYAQTREAKTGLWGRWG